MTQPQKQSTMLQEVKDIEQTPANPLELFPNKQSQSPIIKAIDHTQFGVYADSILEKSHELGEGITLSIVGNEQRGTAFMKYIVYHIVGQDKNGPIDTFRRFNEFYKMRVALVKRFPGCFIPSIPDKAISIVDDQIANKRQRYLRDFIRKMTNLPHLYHSEEFQALLRSKEKDLSSTFQKWPNPTATDIINKYRQKFGELAGKVITTEIRTQIHDFGKLIGATEKHMDKYKNMLKELAASRDSFDKNLPLLFAKSLPAYESQCLVQYVKDQNQLICVNQSQAKFLEHEAIVKQSLKANPYWLIYDLTKHEIRDGRAFLESIKAIEQYENKKYELQVKLSENSKTINDLISSKKTNSQQKFKLQVQSEHLKKQKEAVTCLTDIITALVAFIEMERFKKQKIAFYQNILKKIGGYEINMIQNLAEVWKDWNQKTYESLKVEQDLS